MLRRNFIQVLGAFSLYNSLPFNARFPGSLLQGGSRKLVLIELKGGNDILNTLVPYRNDYYYRARPGLSIQQSDVLRIEDSFGWHPALTYFRELYDSGEICVVSDVGYPNATRSHFTSMDVWHSCSLDRNPTTGWLGRYLDAELGDKSDVSKALALSGETSLVLKGKHNHTMTYENLANASMLYRNLGSISGEQAGSSAVDRIRAITSSSRQSFEELYDLYINTTVKQNFPTDDLGVKLETIARLIKADATPEVYYCIHAGFDTHASQLKTHADLLSSLNNGLCALVKTLKANSHFDDTLILIYSEFSRRVAQNGSRGTDHGKAGGVFLIGGSLNRAGLYNRPSDLSVLDEGDIPFAIDFRSIYSTVLERWLSSSAPVSVMNDTFPVLDFI